MNFIAWTEIESFHNIRKFVKAYPENLHDNPLVQYRAKVKLHGTNAAVQIHADGTVIAQSRTTFLTEGADNAGFAKWVKETESYWKDSNNNARAQVIVYGEWIGPGIQKSVACSEIPKRAFAVFAARPLGGDGLPLGDTLWVGPEVLRDIVSGIPDTYVLPWHINANSIDWSASAEALTLKVDKINEWVNAVEANDPWVESIFGVKGTGEGLVFYPVSNEHLGYENFKNLVFKAKGEKHKNIKSAAPAQVDASSAASIKDFVDLVLTDARLEQGAGMVLVRDDSSMYDMKQLGSFLKWIASDVQKETQDELEASNLDWKDVLRPLSERARTWYITKAKSL